jgi:hypothetical protein
VLLDGLESWRGFLEHSTSSHLSVIRDGPGRLYDWMPSTLGTGLRVGLPFGGALALQVLVSVVAFVAVLRGFYRAGNALDRFMLLALGTFVIGPYALTYDMAVLVTATLLYVTQHRVELTVAEHWAYVAVWLLPFGMVFLPVAGAFLGPVVLGAALVLTLRRVTQSVPATQAVAPAAGMRVVPIAP